jgi:hypothetical protein
MCKLIEICYTKVRMFYKVVRTLANVKYIPSSKKNIISLGTLNSFGNSFSTRNGVIKITNGTFVFFISNRQISLKA